MKERVEAWPHLDIVERPGKEDVVDQTFGALLQGVGEKEMVLDVTGQRINTRGNRPDHRLISVLRHTHDNVADVKETELNNDTWA